MGCNVCLNCSRNLTDLSRLCGCATAISRWCRRNVFQWGRSSGISLNASAKVQTDAVDADVAAPDVTLLLPDEVLAEVFAFLAARELLGPVRAVCRRWRRMTLDRVCWRGRRVSAGGAGLGEEDEEDDPKPWPLVEQVLRHAPCLRELRLHLTVDTPLAYLKAVDARRHQRRHHQGAVVPCGIPSLYLSVDASKKAFTAAHRVLRHLGSEVKSLVLDLPAPAVPAWERRVCRLFLKAAHGAERLVDFQLSLAESYRQKHGDSSALQALLPLLPAAAPAAAFKSVVLVRVAPSTTVDLLRLHAATLESVTLSFILEADAAIAVAALPECTGLTSLTLKTWPVLDEVPVSALREYLRSAAAARLKFLHINLDAPMVLHVPVGLCYHRQFDWVPVLLLEALAASPFISASSLETLCLPYVRLSSSRVVPGTDDGYAERIVAALSPLRKLTTLKMDEDSDALDDVFVEALVSAAGTPGGVGSLRVIDVSVSWIKWCQVKEKTCAVPTLRGLARRCRGMHVVGRRMMYSQHQHLGEDADCTCCREHPELFIRDRQRDVTLFFGFRSHPPDQDCRVCTERPGKVLWMSI